MNTYRFLVFVIIIVATACVDTIDLQLPEAEGGRLVIEGSIERGPDEYQIRASVRRTAQEVVDIVLELEEADIFLMMNGAEVLELANDQSAFVVVDSFHSQYGSTPATAQFQIRVVLPDGKSYTSDAQQILDSPSGSSLEIDLVERPEVNDAGILFEEEYVEVFVNTPLRNDRGNQLSFLWEVSGMYAFTEIAWTNDPGFFPAVCYVPVSAPPDEISVISAADVSGEFLSAFKIAETHADYRFQTGYYFTALQKTLDINAAEYWKQVAASIRQDGTIFDTPPGQILSNIHSEQNPEEEVLGYFFAAGIDTVRYFATPHETGLQTHLCVVSPGEPVCCDCLGTFFNGSKSKPSYWD